jgi:hypothetical protein
MAFRISLFSRYAFTPIFIQVNSGGHFDQCAYVDLIAKINRIVPGIK